jgi:hypothetical protein
VFTQDAKEQAVSLLCNKRPDVYGQHGDILSKQTGKQVIWWVALFRKGEYTDKVLNALAVKSFATLTKEARTAKHKTAKSSIDSGSTSDSSDSSSDESLILEKKNKKPSPQQNLPLRHLLHQSIPA